MPVQPTSPIESSSPTRWLFWLGIPLFALCIALSCYFISSESSKIDTKFNEAHQKSEFMSRAIFKPPGFADGLGSEIQPNNLVDTISAQIIKCANDSNLKAGLPPLNLTDQFLQKFKDDLERVTYSKDKKRGSSYLTDAATTFCSIASSKDFILKRKSEPNYNVFESLINAHLVWWDQKETGAQNNAFGGSLHEFLRAFYFSLIIILVISVFFACGLFVLIRTVHNSCLCCDKKACCPGTRDSMDSVDDAPNNMLKLRHE